MFDSTRSIFPAYSGVGEVRVQWPTPPRASSVNRNLKTLWDIHLNTPHVDANDDAGIAVPLPTDGFDPNGFSEDSRVLEFANRASTPISDETRAEICELLQKSFNRILEIEMADTSTSVGELKARARDEMAGVFCLYNGSSRIQLLKAISLVRALEEVATDWSTASQFSLDAKEEFVEYLKVCPPALEAVVQSNAILRQRALNSTIPVDHIDECLKLLGISDDACEVDANDPEFEGSALKIQLLKTHKEALGRDRLLRGDLSRCFHSVCGQLPAILQSRNCVEIAGSTLSDCREKLKRRQVRCLDRLETLYGKIGEEMRAVGVDPSTLPSLQNEVSQVRKLREATEMISPLRLSSEDCPSTRGYHDKERSIRTLQSIVRQMSPENAGLACEISLILCACDAIASAQSSGDASSQQLSNKLADAIEQIPEQAPSADAQRLSKEIAREIQTVRGKKQERALASLEQAAISADKKALISSFLR